jgi:hypothetical protein
MNPNPGGLERTWLLKLRTDITQNALIKKFLNLHLFLTKLGSNTYQILTDKATTH